MAGSDVKAVAGQSLTIVASIEAEPPSDDVTFELNGNQLMDDSATGLVISHKEYKSTISIERVSRKLCGKLKCLARNVSGLGTGEINIKVEGRPVMPDGRVELTNVTKDSCRLSWEDVTDDGGLPCEYLVEKQIKVQS